MSKPFSVLLQTLHLPAEDLRSLSGAEPVAPPHLLAAAALQSCLDLLRVTGGTPPTFQKAGPVQGQTPWGGLRQSPTHPGPPRAARSPEARPLHQGDPALAPPLPASRPGGMAHCPPPPGALLQDPASPQLPRHLRVAVAVPPCPPPREGDHPSRTTALRRHPALPEVTGRPGTYPPLRLPSTPSRHPPRPPPPLLDPHPAVGRPPSRQADQDRPLSRPLWLEATTTASHVCPKGTAHSTGTCCILVIQDNHHSTSVNKNKLIDFSKPLVVYCIFSCIFILPATVHLAPVPSPLRPMRGRRLWGGTSRHAQVGSFFLRTHRIIS